MHNTHERNFNKTRSETKITEIVVVNPGFCMSKRNRKLEKLKEQI